MKQRMVLLKLSDEVECPSHTLLQLQSVRNREPMKNAYLHPALPLFASPRKRHGTYAPLSNPPLPLNLPLPISKASFYLRVKIDYTI
jgi:hypothetical protein